MLAMTPAFNTLSTSPSSSHGDHCPFLDFSSPRPLYDLVPSPPAVSAAVTKATEPITPEISAKGRKQSLPKHTLFTIYPSPKSAILAHHSRTRHLPWQASSRDLLDEEDDNGDGGTSAMT